MAVKALEKGDVRTLRALMLADGGICSCLLEQAFQLEQTRCMEDIRLLITAGARQAVQEYSSSVLPAPR